MFPAVKALIAGHPLLAYYTMTFAISFGGFVLVGGAGLFSGTSWESDPRFLQAVQAMLAGPPVAGLVMTGLISGRVGLRDLLARLLRWRVGIRWYAAALVTAPLVQAAVLYGLALHSPVFLPAVTTTADRATLLLSGIVVGLIGGLVEELGWTGFAIPRWRQRHGVLTTGLIVGVLWGAWHLLQMLWVGRTSSEGIPLPLFFAQYLFCAVAALTAYRVLMVRVYDRTGSLLVALLMHASYIAATLFILAPPTTGVPFLIYAWVWTAALWLVVAAVAVANGGRRSR